MRWLSAPPLSALLVACVIALAAIACGSRTGLELFDDVDAAVSSIDGSVPRGLDAGVTPSTDASISPVTDAGSDVVTMPIVDAGLAPPSCATRTAGTNDCGPTSESCCATIAIDGGDFFRTYSNDGGGATNLADPATVSAFRLDKYLVTVGRFRPFVAAWNGGAGWTPPAGSGKHTHLNGGNGLVNINDAGYEPGWVASDDAQLAMTDQNLSQDVPPMIVSPSYSTWTAAPVGRENDPIDNVNWYEAYAFCIWDGGFLPSEAEWEFAGAGGDEQREYAWGTTDPGTNSEYAIYSCLFPTGQPKCKDVSNIAHVGTASLGAARWGHLDMAGEIREWVLDAYSEYVWPCVDCADVTPSTDPLQARMQRGGDFSTPVNGLSPAGRTSNLARNRHAAQLTGFRCARAP